MSTKSINFKKIVISTFVLLVLAFLVLALRPLPKATKNNCAKRSGIVSQVLNGEGEGDILVKIKNDKNYYYMNRAADRGYSVLELNEELVNKKIELLTIKHWTPLDPCSSTKHIAQITVGGRIIYSEL